VGDISVARFDLGEKVMTGYAKSALIFINFSRMGGDELDTEERKMYLYGFDLHYQRNRMGTTNQ
jgi:hypothetical protein